MEKKTNKNKNKINFAQIRSIIYKVAFVVTFLIILVGFIAFARGYRISLQDNKSMITSTGILTVGSAPKPAKVYINDELEGVTDINLTLPHDVYDVKVQKEGYTTWEKKVRLKGEIVQSFEAILFPKNPSLSPLTNLGIIKALPLGNSNRVLMFVDKQKDSTEEAELTPQPTIENETEENNIDNNEETIETEDKNGIYLFEEKNQPISILPPLNTVLLKQNLPNEDIELSKTRVIFSPDYSEAIFIFVVKDTNVEKITNPADLLNNEEIEIHTYLLSLKEENTEPLEITGSEEPILSAWKKDKQEEIAKVIETFPKKIRKVASNSFEIISFSPDETKVLYQAKKEIQLPLAIDPPVIGSNPTEQDRKLKMNNLYVYDKKEDKNFTIPFDEKKIPPVKAEVAKDLSENKDAENLEIDLLIKQLKVSNYIQWYPSSRHLVYNEEDKITIIEYDGLNKETVYSGPYETEFFGTSSDWKLFILANLNPQNNKYADLYEVGIR
jgi:hypothetical protein